MGWGYYIVKEVFHAGSKFFFTTGVLFSTFPTRTIQYGSLVLEMMSAASSPLAPVTKEQKNKI
jgi:hypothetical protein